jgi:arsenical pump membrane protein
MYDYNSIFPIIIFLLTITIVLLKPWNINETIPTIIGAILFLMFNIVPLNDIYFILQMVSGASITILSTIVMSIVLESVGFFRWVAYNLVNKSKGSGVRLYIYINVLCYLMTLFFNNDGSILITTPIIIRTVRILNLKPHQQSPYLLSGVLVATAASAPIAISNIANLIALKIVGLDLNSYVAMMFVPSMIGIITIVLLLYVYFRKDIPTKLPPFGVQLENYKDHHYSLPHPLSNRTNDKEEIDWWMFRVCIISVVIIRGSYFLLSPLGISMEWIAIVGALLLIAIRWYRKGTGVLDVVKKTPWHILIFAFGMYVLVYGLKNIGLTSLLVNHLGTYVQNGPFYAIFIMGGLLTVLSNLCNNLPSVMIGTLSITEMNLDSHLLQVAYLANVLGSDIGALLTPIGTLATLLWMHILRQHSISISWRQYFKVTFKVIPIGLFVSLISLYFWTQWLFL